tara:strand:+ start:62 stop:292 length:231 start_codon:yes stop_codon:yes gene_type:complete
MTKYYVKVTQTHEFYIDAHNEKHAKRIALEDYIWDEHQTYPNTYNYKIDVEEDNDQEELHNDAVIDNKYERSCDES